MNILSKEELAYSVYQQWALFFFLSKAQIEPINLRQRLSGEADKVL